MNILKLKLKLILIFTTQFFLYFTHAEDKFTLVFETGGVWQNRNDVQITPSAGTRVDIDKVKSGPFLHYRLEALYRINNRHGLRLLYAPANIKVKTELSQNIIFNDKVFTSGNDLTIRYKFNSYRFSYMYRVWADNNNYLDLGVTAKVRDAKISFSQVGLEASYDNIGFVPLLYFDYVHQFANSLSVNLKFDFAAAPQGRAIDASLIGQYSMDDSLILGLGVRTLEGGADNEKVFTFSWFNYLVAEVRKTF